MLKKSLMLLLAATLFVLRLSAIDTESYVADFGRDLISSNIRSITQDDQGYIWMGSSYGLLRYDGFYTHTYLHSANGNDSLLYDNHIRDVIYWAEGLVVIRMQGYLCTLFDTRTGRFTPFPVNKAECRRYNRITMGLHHDLWIYNDKHEGICLTLTSAKDKNKKFNLRHYGLGKVPRDILGHHWDNAYNTVYTTRDGQIEYTDRITGKRFTFPIFDNGKDGKPMKVSYKVQTVGDLIWVGTYGAGITVYDKRTGAMTRIRKEDGSALTTNFIITIFADRQGNVWALQDLQGVVCFSVERKRQIVISLRNKDGNEQDEYVKAVAPLPDGSSLISVNSGRLLKMSCDHQVSPVAEMDNDAVLTIHVSADGHTVFGSRQHGIRLDGKWYRHHSNDPESLSGNKVSEIAYDKKGRLWIALQDGRVDVAIRQGDEWKFRHVLPPDIYTSIATDHLGNVWASGVGRLMHFNPDKILCDSTAYHIHNLRGVQDITQVMEDSHHRLWVASLGKGAFWAYNNIDEGISAKGGKILSFHSVDYTDGLASNMVASIIEDRFGHIYLATQKGMSIYDPSTGKLQMQLTGRSVGHNYFTDRASCRLADGRLAFGTIDGIVIFTPQEKTQDSTLKSLHSSLDGTASSLRVTDVLVNGSSIIGLTDDGLLHRLYEKNELSVAHNENSLTFRFSDFKFNALGKTVFSYMLEGYDRLWSATAVSSSGSGASNAMAVYKNLPYGRYTFRVRAYTTDKQNYEEYTLRVVVRSPWWLTWWAFVGYCILATIIVTLVYRQLRATYRLRQRIALEKQMTEFKLRFFTNISHEFRTPLTLIHGSIGRIRNSKDLPSDIKQPLSILSRSEGRMMRLVNQLLDFRKIEAGKLRLSLQETDVTAFIRNIFNSFIESANDRRITYTFLPQTKEMLMYVDRGHLDKIAYNLISNAIKYTPSGESITVGVRREVSSDTEVLKVIVSDTGIGIDKEQQKHLFQRFMQDAHTSGSMGIGLNLSLELARVHKGSIDYSVNKPKGSVFTLTLPYVTSETVPYPYTADDFMVADGRLLSDCDDNVKSVGLEYHEMKALPLNDRMVLVVDDDADIMNFLRQLLQRHFNVLACTGGEDALNLLKNNEDIALVITDIMMPGMSGYQLVKAIKGKTVCSSIPIVVITALSDPSDQKKGIDLGIDAFITKPFDSDVLISTCLNLIAKHDLQRSEKAKMTKGEATVTMMTPPPIIKDEQDKRWINALDVWIESHIADPTVTVDNMAEAMKMSRTAFYSKAKELIGMTPNDILRKQRMERSAVLLKEGRLNVTEVAEQTGFTSVHYFTQAFKQFYGITPKKYQLGK